MGVGVNEYLYIHMHVCNVQYEFVLAGEGPSGYERGCRGMVF